MVPRRTYSSGLRRDLDILGALALPQASRAGGLGVLRLAQLTGRDKSQVSRALAALAEEGLVERDQETLLYRPGWRLYSLAAQTAEARLTAVARPYLQQLVAQIHETTHLCVLRGGEVLTVLSESPSHVFRGVGWEGITVRAPATSAGRALISDWQPEVIRAWFTPELLASAASTRPLTIDGLLEEVTRIRQYGYATVDEEFEIGVVGCSAPVRDHRGRVVAAINVAAPKGRLGDKLDAAGRLTARAATDLSTALGSRPTPS